MEDEPASLTDYILNQTELVVDIQRELTAAPALGPENGVQGELEKAATIERFLQADDIKFFRFDCPDEHVASGIRPNIIATINGKSDKKLWLFGHMDVVPPGDLSLWASDPWTVKRSGDIIYGRGVEDNQQAVTSMLLLAHALKALKIIPELCLGLVFMADEECGSKYGLSWLLETQPNLFSEHDLYIVPDGGSPGGESIEIAEKSQMWIRFTVNGKQCHASMPQLGKNAFVCTSALCLALTELNSIFAAKNPLFDPPTSTFVPTKHDANVPSVNILPGKDVFYMDCRILPEVDIELVKAEIAKICARFAAEYDMTIDFEVIQSQPASQTAADSPIILCLQNAVKDIYGIMPVTVGIGGATVAAMLRTKGLPAVVWSNILNTCHQPDECSSIQATCKDAAVFGRILMDGCGNT